VTVTERRRTLCKRSVLPAAVVFVGVTVGYSALALHAPRFSDRVLYLLFPASLFALATASCGWLFFACVLVLQRGEVTLEDEFGDPTTYYGKAAAAWAWAGIVLAGLLWLLGLAVPVGFLLEWLGVL
jgi:hypothetical protein